MPSWQDDYLRALQERDKWEKANQTVFDKYAKLADRTANFHRIASVEKPSLQAETKSASPKSQDHRVSKFKDSSSNPDSSEVQAKFRQDLSEAQRSRGLLETRLQTVTEELQKLKVQSSLDNKRLRELSKENVILTRGLRDRDEELKGKAKLVEDVHDETVALTLQLNMADERSQKLEKENKELVDRWMKRIAQEADAMNDESKFS